MEGARRLMDRHLAPHKPSSKSIPMGNTVRDFYARGAHGITDRHHGSRIPGLVCVAERGVPILCEGEEAVFAKFLGFGGQGGNGYVLSRPVGSCGLIGSGGCRGCCARRRSHGRNTGRRGADAAYRWWGGTGIRGAPCQYEDSGQTDDRSSGSFPLCSLLLLRAVAVPHRRPLPLVLVCVVASTLTLQRCGLLPKYTPRGRRARSYPHHQGKLSLVCCGDACIPLYSRLLGEDGCGVVSCTGWDRGLVVYFRRSHLLNVSAFF